jgi:transposase
LAPLFTPVLEALQAQQLSEGLCHADETGWRVFEPIADKVGYRWYLWVIRSASAIVFVMAPGRGAKVPLRYFSKLLVQTVLVCDRYAAYKKVARIMGLLLAFCWAHVRRDYLTLARSYPDTEAWAMGWVQRIGTLYHLNAARLAVRDDPVSFVERDRRLRAHLEQMAVDRDAQLADASLRRAARKVLVSLQNHWKGLTVFVERPEIAMGRVSDWRGNHALRGVAVVRQSRCLNPRRGSRFQSLLVEPDMQITRIRLSRMSLRPSLSSRLHDCREGGRGRASHKDTRSDIGGIQCLASLAVVSTIAADARRCNAG